MSLKTLARLGGARFGGGDGWCGSDGYDGRQADRRKGALRALVFVVECLMEFWEKCGASLHEGREGPMPTTPFR